MSEIDIRKQMAEGFEALDARLTDIELTQTRNMLATVFWGLAVVLIIKVETLGPFLATVIVAAAAAVGFLGWQFVYARRRSKKTSRPHHQG